MNNIITDRLNKLDITVERINDTINELINSKICEKFTDYSIFIYCSHIENLGNSYSDFDIYVVFNSEEFIEKTLNEIKINNIPLDVELWDINQINILINMLNSKKLLSLNELKLLHRITVAEIIRNKEYGLQIQKSINKKLIKNSSKDIFTYNKISSMEDCVKLFKARDYESALVIARNIVQHSVAVLNIDNDNINLKEKWITRIFLNNKGYYPDLLEKYKNLYLYPNIKEDNLKNHITELLDFSEELSSKTMFD